MKARIGPSSEMLLIYDPKNIEQSAHGHIITCLTLGLLTLTLGLLVKTYPDIRSRMNERKTNLTANFAPSDHTDQEGF